MSDRFDALVQAVVQAQDDVRARTSRRAQVRAALLRRAEAPTRTRWIWLAVPAVAVAVLAILMLRPGPSLTFEHGPEHARGVVGEWLAAPAERGETLRFSDGSEIDLHPHTRARVALLDGDEVSVVIEAGSADASIESGASRRWHVHAGPYRVEVTGTRFSFAWDPSSERFDLELHEGTVMVHGPGLPEEQRVSAGESLHVAPGELALRTSSATSREAIALEEAAPPTRTDPAPRVDDTEPIAVAPEPGPRPRPRSRAPAPDAVPDAAPVPAPEGEATIDSAQAWRELAAKARYRDALAAAEDYGFASLCESLSEGDLLQLADVARFARKPARAIEALRAVRRRFPDTDAAATAAFERGRIANASGSAYPEAAKWFATYLREAEQGPLAREALARLMEVQSTAGHHAEARETAKQYLQRFPKGPDADIASKLVAAPD